MKDILEALDSRIKSPVFGYFILSMIAVNWKSFFFLFFDDGTVISRIIYFEVNTNSTSLFFYPIFFSVLYSLIYPWVQCIFIWTSSTPVHFKNMLEINSKHKLLGKQQELESLRKDKIKKDELEVIERAKRDQKIEEEITDEEIREKVQSEIESIRDDHKDNTKRLSDLTTDHEEVLQFMASKDGIAWDQDIIKNINFGSMKTKFLIQDLYEKGFIEIWSNPTHSDAVEYKMTTKAMKLVVEKGFVK